MPIPGRLRCVTRRRRLGPPFVMVVRIGRPRSSCVNTGEEVMMSGVRVLVGTKKGAFVLTADGTRDRWKVSGPHFAGWEIYHMKGSPADPNRIYASQTSGWFGQIIQRSSDGGQTWETP